MHIPDASAVVVAWAKGAQLASVLFGMSLISLEGVIGPIRPMQVGPAHGTADLPSALAAACMQMLYMLALDRQQNALNSAYNAKCRMTDMSDLCLSVGISRCQDGFEGGTLPIGQCLVTMRIRVQASMGTKQLNGTFWARRSNFWFTDSFLMLPQMPKIFRGAALPLAVAAVAMRTPLLATGASGIDATAFCMP